MSNMLNLAIAIE